MDHCTFCGAELPAPARFCGSCGRANITTGEMPTHLSGYAAGNVTVENAPTAITGPARPVIFPTAGRNTRSQGPNTPPVALPGEEPEEERRRALLLGLPLAAGLVESSTAGVPGVVGTAQPEGVPLVEGNPAGAPAARSPQVAGAMAGGSAAPGAGWIYTPPPSAPSSWPASSPAPVPARGTPHSGTRARWWLLRADRPDPGHHRRDHLRVTGHLCLCAAGQPQPQWGERGTGGRQPARARQQLSVRWGHHAQPG
jgi:hypothetical protein